VVARNQEEAAVAARRGREHLVGESLVRGCFVVELAGARNSASAHEWETIVCFFVFQAMEPPRNTK
jgi:hypothetical protein